MDVLLKGIPGIPSFMILNLIKECLVQEYPSKSLKEDHIIVFTKTIAIIRTFDEKAANNIIDAMDGREVGESVITAQICTPEIYSTLTKS